MKKLLVAALGLSLLLSPVAFVGCAGPQTKEAIVFHSFRDSWDASRSAYRAWQELVVSGKISPTKEAAVDKAWNNYRATFRLAFDAATRNWDATTPQDVERLRVELLNLIRQYSK